MSATTPAAGLKRTGGRLLALSLGWGVAMAASAFVGLHLRRSESSGRADEILLLFFIGGLLAFPPTMLLARRIARNWNPERRFAMAFVTLGITTIGMTALAFAIQYRLYYSQWHDAPFTIRWGFELFFTTLAALYQFAVMGMPLFLPLGLPALLVASVVFARSR